jgi:hypothetical protein
MRARAGSRNAVDLAGHLAGQHVCDHLEIADKRPERVFEGRRPVLFDNEVSEPRESVTNDEKQREKVPASGGEKPDK